MHQKIIRNSAKCLLCNEEIESKSVHDYRTCSCDNIMVDGGLDYLRRGWRKKEYFQETSIIEELTGETK